MKLSKAAGVCVLWILAALLFNIGIYVVQGQHQALAFLTGYIIEMSLSVDNLFVFFLIFSYFKIDLPGQSRILFWGVLGAQVMRAIFILGGLALLKHFSWVIYAFGILLVASGFKIFFKKDKEVDLDQNILIRFLKRFASKDFSTFLIVLIAVEVADLVFAVDSIPAVLAITKDPFIVYSSNIFAILGLRALYLVLSPIFDRVQYLHYALGLILVFVGIKMLLDHIWQIPVAIALGFIITVLAVFTAISILMNNYKRGKT